MIDLVVRARDGDAAAWDDIVERYAALVWSVCRRHGLNPADTDDVGGSVWLRLVENLGKLQVPAALPGWLATTTQRECLKLLRAKKRNIPVDDPELGDDVESGSEEGLLIEERRHALRLAFIDLPDRCKQLLTMLFEDPPTPYAEISSTLDMPVGAIGPNRARCLDRLRRTGALAALAPAWPPDADRK